MCIRDSNIDYDESIEIATDILEKVRRSKIEHKYSEVSDFVTVSVGISTSKEFKYYLDLIKEADEALYIAKNNGKNKHVHLRDSR